MWSWSQHSLRPSHPPGSRISILIIVCPDHLQVQTPRRLRRTLDYSARGEIPDVTFCPAQEAFSNSICPRVHLPDTRTDLCTQQQTLIHYKNTYACEILVFLFSDNSSEFLGCDHFMLHSRMPSAVRAREGKPRAPSSCCGVFDTYKIVLRGLVTKRIPRQLFLVPMILFQAAHVATSKHV